MLELCEEKVFVLNNTALIVNSLIVVAKVFSEDNRQLFSSVSCDWFRTPVGFVLLVKAMDASAADFTIRHTTK